MNTKQKIVLSFALPLLLGVAIYPPHHESGHMSGVVDGNAFKWALEDSWVLRPLVAPKEMDITLAEGAAKSHREYTLMPWVWLGALLTILVLGGSLIFLFRSKEEPAQDKRIERRNASGPVRDLQTKSPNAQRRVDEKAGHKRKATAATAQFRVIR